MTKGELGAKIAQGEYTECQRDGKFSISFKIGDVKASVTKVGKSIMAMTVISVDISEEDYNKILDEYRIITKEFERRKSAWESAKKVKEQYAKKFEELDNRRAELDAEIKAESCDVSAFWDAFFRQCLGE